MPPYVRGQAGQQQNPIRDIAATITGRASSTDYTSSESCTPTGTVEQGSSRDRPRTSSFSRPVFRTLPVVEREQTVGQVTEREKLTLQVPKYVNGRAARCK